jgi:uncharacterized protein (TIGR02453 family)
MLQSSTVKFLKDLKKNNNKEWFDVNRKAYEAAKEDFANLVKNLLERYNLKDEELASLTVKDCVFRINRDVRFSKNKEPYKTNMGASLNRGGKKSIYAGYYFHLEPGECFVGGGLWMPEAEHLKKVRQEIDYSFDEFKRIITDKKFKSTYGDLYTEEGVKLSRPPKGYDDTNPAIEFIKLKSFLAMQKIADAELTDKNLVKKIMVAFEVLQPMVKFINRSLE